MSQIAFTQWSYCKGKKSIYSSLTVTQFIHAMNVWVSSLNQCIHSWFHSISSINKHTHTPTNFPDYQMEDITFTHRGPTKCETVHSPNDSPQSSVRQCIRPFSFHSAIVQCSGIKKITHTNEGGRSLCPPLLRDPSGSKNEKRKINHACLLSCVIPAHPATYGCSMILKKFIDGIEDGANNVEPIIL